MSPVVALLRRNRDFRAVFCAQVVSYLGDWFAVVALTGLVEDLTRSAVLVSLVFVATTFPAFFISPLAGPTVDRFDRRRLMILVSLTQAAAAMALLLVRPGRVWVAFAAQACIATGTAFFMPASQAAIPNLVDPDDLPAANAAMGSTWGVMLAVGAGLGGLFTVAFGRTAAFVADAISFVVAAALIASVRRPTGEARVEAHPRMRPLADTAEAIRYARRNKPVLALLMSKAGYGVAGGVVGIVPVIATRIFGAGDGGIGALLAARGVGAFLGPALSRRFTDRTARILLACGCCGLVFGVGYALVPFSPALGVACAAVLWAHLGGGAQWTLSTVGLQRETPDALRGRIFAGDFALVTLTLALSSFVSGAASQRFGPRPVTLALAGLSVAWSAVYLLATRGIRRAKAAAVGSEAPAG